MASLGRLVAGIAHELNTPLGTARTVTSSLAARLPELRDAVTSPAGTGERVDRVIRAFERGLDLVSEGLARSAEMVSRFKQVAVDQTSVARRVFSVREVVENNVEALLPSFVTRKVSVDLDIPDDIRIESYPGPLGQAITNILQNAYVHAFGDRTEGNVVIRAHWSDAKRKTVTLVFSDDGVGISEPDLRWVFDPFYSTKLGSGGTGLGMHIVYNIVKRVLGGRVDVRNRATGGAEFHIVIPVDAPVLQVAVNWADVE